MTTSGHVDNGNASSILTIEADHASKLFGNRKAVNDVSFQIKRGEVVGFLGPNGAGKTTTMRMLTSYYTPDIGNVKISGIDTQESDLETRGKIGYLPENNPLYGDLLVHEYLSFVAELRGLSGKDKIRNIDSAVEEVRLTEVYYLPISFLSKGYKQRTGLAAAILHRPEILIMDEPTEGLDPNQRVSMRDLIKSLGKDRTVLMSTHVLGEIEGTCDRLLVINRGKLIADDPVSTISRRVRSSKSVIVEVQGTSVEKSLKKLKDITDLEREDGIGDRKKFLLTFDGENDPRPDIFRMAKDQNWVLWELRESELKLQDVFQALTAQNPNLETDGDNQTSPEIDRLN
ncbi:MAG: ABC-2 type transport system ATP-binding protein [Chloroflexi bacterium]|jgi:ABC-2 type transport system ATP-binding protein|nr:MAG: ABC-2 type transport system ATP-binding protein [Chloroflexota bacterium]